MFYNISIIHTVSGNARFFQLSIKFILELFKGFFIPFGRGGLFTYPITTLQSFL
jgi:hypothetical protein